GFQLGPGVGDVMAELISTGTTSTSISPFDIRRFDVSLADNLTEQTSKAS
ncbi:FAD dependent oxidoreductase, partial [Pseudomonas syringae pv. aceris str. M302273]